MTEFVRFPHTAHFAWLGPGAPRDDKLLSPAEARALLSSELIVEEKLDGANLGISAIEGELHFQNRGQYLISPLSGQFSRIAPWRDRHREALISVLGENLILFGEWCAARHSLAYDHLPDWFVAFDVYDRSAGRFWSTQRRNELAGAIGIPIVPQLSCGRTTLAALTALINTRRSYFGAATLEGVVIRREDRDFLEARAKLVRADFTQAISDHWSSRAIEWNTVAQP
jgi:ATP-dependent RNA circularization protein (DNA/RNA ligase family)